MTKKDYIRIASVFGTEKALMLATPKNEIRDAQLIMHRHLGETLADSLAEDNPRFDRERFLKACGVQS